MMTRRITTRRSHYYNQHFLHLRNIYPCLFVMIPFLFLIFFNPTIHTIAMALILPSSSSSSIRSFRQIMVVHNDDGTNNKNKQQQPKQQETETDSTTTTKTSPIIELLYKGGYGTISSCNNNIESILDLLYQSTPDLIVMDISSSSSGGSRGRGSRSVDSLDIISILKSNHNNNDPSSIILYNHIPILLLSSRGMTSDRIHAFQNGVDGYLSIPFDSDECLALVDRLVGRYDEVKGAHFWGDEEVEDGINLNFDTLNVVRRQPIVGTTMAISSSGYRNDPSKGERSNEEKNTLNTGLKEQQQQQQQQHEKEDENVKGIIILRDEIKNLRMVLQDMGLVDESSQTSLENDGNDNSDHTVTSSSFSSYPTSYKKVKGVSDATRQRQQYYGITGSNNSNPIPLLAKGGRGINGRRISRGGPLTIPPSPSLSKSQPPTSPSSSSSSSSQRMIPTIDLTTSERQVLDLLCNGLTNKEIAYERGTTSAVGVGNIVSRLYTKTGSRTRTELLRWAMRAGYVPRIFE